MAKYEGISDHSELALTALHRKDATCKTNYHKVSHLCHTCRTDDCKSPSTGRKESQNKCTVHGKDLINSLRFIYVYVFACL